MKNPLGVLCGGVFVLLSAGAGVAADPTWNYSVQASAAVQESPARISLTWRQDTYGTPGSYTVYRKSVGGTSWGSGTTLAGSTTSYVDTNVVVGASYEYQIVKAASGYNGYGYVSAGIRAPLIDNRGKVLLVVDSTHAASLASELARLQQDLAGDGWTVIRQNVARNDSATSVKNLIRSAYNSDPSNVKAVFLFGHVPVPYSGNIFPDGHEDHQGAWPADAYYGDMDGNWTDNSVSNAGGRWPRNHNVPGDGKFDQSTLPSNIELQVGRVDLANMPGRRIWDGPATFPSEVELLRQYLNKDNNFRHKRMNAPARGVVYDMFGTMGGEAFSASAYRSFAPLLGVNQIVTIDAKGQWMPHLVANNYLWAYGAGAGSFSTIGGLGNTGQYQDGTTLEIVDGDIKAVFTMLFGSWLGDWDSDDNIMRAVLATRSMGLSCSWSGRPHWFYHHLGLGETLGYSTLIAQNNGNGGLYRTQVNSASRNIHIALMGDPTLRMHPVAPPSNLRAVGNSLTWSASTDSVIGYHIYRAANPNGPFTRLTGSPITATGYADSVAGSFAYMVRAVKLESTPSGSYSNASQGIFITTGGAGGGDTIAPAVSITAPLHNATLSGSSVNVSAIASDNVGVVGVQFKVDGTDLGVEDTTAPYSVSWNTGAFTNGTHTLRAVARDAAGNQTTSGSISVIVSNGIADTIPPTVAISSPSNNATLSGSSVIVSATASDNVAVAGVQFRLDGVDLGAEDTSSPYSITWDTTQASMGVHLLTALARDAAGNLTTSAARAVVVTNTPRTAVIWVDDAVPAGATTLAEGGDSWNWITSNPPPFSGAQSHQSSHGTNMHQHLFNWASATLTVNTGETLFAYVYLDPVNPPQQIMLQWTDGSWDHRAYWGANILNYGVDGTSTRRYMGPLPVAGQWVRLEVPASSVDLQGRTLKGMAFTLYGGRVTWDAAGKSMPFNAGPITASMRITTNGAIVSWSSEAGRTYRVEYKDDLAQTNWTLAAPNVIAAGANSLWIDTTSANARQRFYRVGIVE